MKKFTLKFISLLFCLVFSLSLFACNPNDDEVESEDKFDTYVDTVNKEEISDSSTLFISNGVSNYHILLSSNVDDNRKLVQEKASSEINFFLKDAGYPELPITYDNEIDGVDFNKKYISIGNTTYYQAYLEQNELKNDLDFFVLGNDGYKIRTNKNTVLINAYGNNGILYGAYGFLQRNMQYRYYAKDEWTITKNSNVLLKNMNVVAVPDFSSRYIDTATYSSNSDWIIRLRNHGRSKSYVEGLEDGGWVGNDTSICSQFLKSSVYYNEHPNWYWGDGTNKNGQLCFSTVLSNKEEDGKPLDEMFKNVLENYILPNFKARVVMFGINDNSNNYCKCDACIEECRQIKRSGQVCLLVNAMQKKYNDWQKSLPETDVNKDRKITFAFFAYLYCMDAPTNYDFNTKTYTLIDYDAPYKCFGGDGEKGDGDSNDLELKLIGNVNISVRIAHLRAENMHTQYDEEYNALSYQMFESWSVIAPTLSVWDYGTSFSDYIAPYPDWSVIKNNLVYYRMKGVKELLTQLPAHTSGTSFYAMMLYVRSMLTWDVDLDIEELYKDFILNYYGPQAYDSIYAYFTFLRNYFKKADEKHIDEDGNVTYGFVNADGLRVSYHGDIYEVLTSKTYFPYVTTMELKEFFNQAESNLNANKNSEPKYQKYLDRVQVESLFVRYMELKNYSNKYSDSDVTLLVNEFERIANLGNLTQFDNGGKNGATQVKDFINSFR